MIEGDHDDDNITAAKDASYKGDEAIEMLKYMEQVASGEVDMIIFKPENPS